MSLFPVRSVSWRGRCLASPSREVQPLMPRSRERRDGPHPVCCGRDGMRINQADEPATDQKLGSHAGACRTAPVCGRIAATPTREQRSMIHVVAIITAKPGMREAILKEFRANMPAVHAEKGCIEYGPAVDAEAWELPDQVRRRHVRGDREMGKPRGAEGARRLAAHGGLWREDARHDRESRHPRAVACLNQIPSPASRGRIRIRDSRPTDFPQDLTKYPQLFLLAA